MRQDNFRYANNASILLAELILAILLIIIILSSCAQIHTKTTFTDGRIIETDAIEIGSTVALKDFKDTMTKDGREISAGSASGDVNAQALGTAAFGLAKGFAEGVK